MSTGLDLTIVTVGHSNHEPQAFVELLQGTGIATLIDVRSQPYSGFAPHFSRSPLKRSMGAAAGRASLGIDPGYRPRLTVKDGKPRCVVVDPDLEELDLSLTDVGFHTESGGRWVPDLEAVENVQKDLKGGRAVLLAVGLTRPWPNDNPRHWLQVNAIHLEPDASDSGSTRAYDTEAIRENHPNAYRPWTDEDEQLLKMLHARNQSCELMAEALGRQLGGIKSRLRRLGLID